MLSRYALINVDVHNNSISLVKFPFRLVKLKTTVKISKGWSMFLTIPSAFGDYIVNGDFWGLNTFYSPFEYLVDFRVGSDCYA